MGVILQPAVAKTAEKAEAGRVAAEKLVAGKEIAAIETGGIAK